MADVLSREQRSRNMASIRGKDTRPEMILRSALHRAGLRFRLHQPSLPGRPDIVLKRHRAVIFIHGCFWHVHTGCRYAAVPTTRARFWRLKLTGNRNRDAQQVKALSAAGWRVLIVWECALRDPAQRIRSTARAAKWAYGSGRYAEIPAEAASNI